MKSVLKIIDVLILLYLCGCSNNDIVYKNVPHIKIGSASISVKLIDGDAEWPDSIKVYTTAKTILTNSDYESILFALTFENNSWTGQIPMEIMNSDKIPLLIKRNQVPILSTYISVNQDTHTEIEITRDGINNYHFNYIQGDGCQPVLVGINEELTIDAIAYIYMNFGGSYVPKTIYESKSWEQYINCEIDSIFPNLIFNAYNGISLPTEEKKHFLKEELMRILFLGRVSKYVDNAKIIGNVTVENPPVEFYKSFIGQMDLSPEILLDEFGNPTVLNFLKFILKETPLSIPPIEDKPINEWISNIRPEIEKIISPDPQFLNLLSAASYLIQIEDENKPLSDAQRYNIKNYYKDDLADVILHRNERIKKQLENALITFIDLSPYDSIPDFQALMSEYANRPVIVDFWNTWCSGCIQSMRLIDTKKVDLINNGIGFLYVADTSSPENTWRVMAERESGIHVRLSNESIKELMGRYNLNAFPSYLLFNAEHELVEAFTGFPGIDQFMESVEKLGSF